MKSIKNAPIGCTDFRPATTTTGGSTIGLPREELSRMRPCQIRREFVPSKGVQVISRTPTVEEEMHKKPMHKLARRVAIHNLYNPRLTLEDLRRWAEEGGELTLEHVTRREAAESRAILRQRGLQEGSPGWRSGEASLLILANDYVREISQMMCKLADRAEAYVADRIAKGLPVETGNQRAFMDDLSILDEDVLDLLVEFNRRILRATGWTLQFAWTPPSTNR